MVAHYIYFALLKNAARIWITAAQPDVVLEETVHIRSEIKKEPRD